MKKYILDFVCKLEGFKTGIKQLHWAAKSLSQHQLCDDIATIISDYQDKVSEVEQSISGKLPVNNLKGTPYKVTSLKKFVEDVISATNSFYSKLKKEGNKYIGMRSDTEAVLSDLQRQLYLVNFTIKEELKERLRNKINEGRVTISNGRKSYSMTENELRELVSEAINNVNNKNTHNMKRTVRLTEGDLHRIIKKSVFKILKEDFEQDFNTARDNHIGRGGMFGMELKNSEGDWEYGDVTYDPNTNTMSCMGVSIQVDPDLSIDQNLDGLYEELISNGYNDGEDENDDWSDEEIETRIDTEANMDDFPV